jgi:hypothetical protein
MVTNVGMFVDSYAYNKVGCIEQYAHKFHWRVKNSITYHCSFQEMDALQYVNVLWWKVGLS